MDFPIQVNELGGGNGFKIHFGVEHDELQEGNKGRLDSLIDQQDTPKGTA